MDEDLKIVLKTELEADTEGSVKRISAQIPEIEKRINALSKSLKLKVEIDDKVINAQVQTAAKKMQKQLELAVNPRKLSKVEIFEGLESSGEKAVKIIESSVNEAGKLSTITRQLNKETESYYVATEKVTENYEKARKEAEKLAQINERDNASRIQFLSKQQMMLKGIEAGYTGKTSQKGLSDASHLQELNNRYNQIVSQIQSYRAISGKLTAEQKNNIQEQINALKLLAKEYQNVEYSATDLRAKKVSESVKKFRNDLSAYVQEMKLGEGYTDDFRKRVNQLFASLNNVKNAGDLHNWQDQFALLKTDMRLFNKELAAGVKSFVLGEKIQKADADLKKLAKDWSALFSNKRLAAEYNSLGVMLGNVSSRNDLTKYNASLATFKAHVRDAGKDTKTLSEHFKSVGKQVLGLSVGFGSLYQVANTLRSGIQTVVDLDYAMIDLRKVTSGTEEQYASFYHTANETAKALDSTTEKVISQTADWARLGYSLQEASKLAQNSMIFTSVSPGMDQQQATDGLVSIIKAYGIEVNDTLDGIISKINDVGKWSCPAA